MLLVSETKKRAHNQVRGRQWQLVMGRRSVLGLVDEEQLGDRSDHRGDGQGDERLLEHVSSEWEDDGLIVITTVVSPAMPYP